jgi:hypothetical protein
MMWQFKGYDDDVFLKTYCKVASSNTSHLGAHVGFFRLIMKGLLDPYVLPLFDKKLIF